MAAGALEKTPRAFSEGAFPRDADSMQRFLGLSWRQSPRDLPGRARPGNFSDEDRCAGSSHSPACSGVIRSEGNAWL